MTQWLFTQGRLVFMPLLLPLICLGIFAPLAAAGVLGLGIRRSSETDAQRWRSAVRLIAVAMVGAAIIAVYTVLLGETAAARGTGSVQRQIIYTAGLAFSLLIGCGAVWAGLRSGGWLRERTDRVRRPNPRRGEMGSAHFCTPHEYMRFRTPDPGGVTLLGAFWGADHRRLDVGRGRFCLSADDAARGILALGAPGSGKTQSVILPIIADRMAAGHSLIIADPQGELGSYVLDFARWTGHLVAIHDPTSTTCPRFNLAEGITSIPEANAIARVLIPAGQGDNRFWTETATDLLSGCLLRFDNLGQIKQALGDINRLAAILRSRDDDAVLAAGSFLAACGTESKVAPNTVATLGTALTGWAAGQVRASTCASDFDAGLLLEQRTVIVLTCPGSVRDVYAPYLGAVLRKLMRDLDSIGERAGGALPAPIGVILDEFPTLGRLDGLLADVNLVRKRRIGLVIAAQTKGQFHLIYGEEGTKSLLTGLATQIVFGGGDHDTAKFYSDASGQATVDTNPDPRKALMRQRPLLTTDEVVSPEDGTCHIFARFVGSAYAGQVVVKARLTRMFERADWRHRLGVVRKVEPLRFERRFTLNTATDALPADPFGMLTTESDRAVLERIEAARAAASREGEHGI